MAEINPTKVTYDNLLVAYEFMNKKLFDGKLPGCLITLQREKKTFGYFCGNKFMKASDPEAFTDEIALNPQYFRSEGRDDKKVISTLVHEMVHLWQHHFGKPGRGRYHNKEWAGKMVDIGLIPSSTGHKGGKNTGDRVTHYIEPGGHFEVEFNALLLTEFLLEWIELPVDYLMFATTAEEDKIKTTSGLVESLENDENGGEKVKWEMPDKSNRFKYTCMECGLNAWARPDAFFICGKCNEHMQHILKAT